MSASMLSDLTIFNNIDIHNAKVIVYDDHLHWHRFYQQYHQHINI